MNNFYSAFMNSNARTLGLAESQQDQYHSHGFVSGLNALSGPEIQRVRAYVDDRIAELAERDAYSINCFQARLATLWDLCHQPAIVDAVESVLGPNIVCWATHLFNKQPGDTRSVPWHQDAVFWHLTPRQTCTVWLAIDDADDENSALRFIPGSHKEGGLEWEALDGQDVLDKQVPNAEQFGEPVTNTLKAGQFSVHHDLLLHGSQPNTSARRRCGLTFRFCTPEVRITDPEWEKGIEGIIVRGDDPSGYWRHHTRPDKDSVVGEYGPRNLGGN